jgi:hypothetical protein
MNLITDLYFTIKWKIEDALFAIKDKFNNDKYDAPFVAEEYVEEVEVKPKKKKAKKKAKNKK